MSENKTAKTFHSRIVYFFSKTAAISIKDQVEKRRKHTERCNGENNGKDDAEKVKKDLAFVMFQIAKNSCVFFHLCLIKLKRGKVTNFTVNIIVNTMEEGKRQKQIASLLNEEMNKIFQRLGLNMIDGGMVSISSVKVTPDLLEARFYLSFFQVKDEKDALKKIEDRHHDIKKELAAKVRHQLRSIPVLKFFKDDTLDHVFKMEEIFKKISEERNTKDE